MLGRGIGFIAFVVASSSATGPTVAAAVLAVGSWHWLFAVNILPGILALWLAARVLPETPRNRHRFDLLGAALNGATLGLLVIAVDELGRGESLLWAGSELATAAVLGAIFVSRELSRTAPILPVDLSAGRSSRCPSVRRSAPTPRKGPPSWHCPSCSRTWAICRRSPPGC
ncbi:MAG: hypothetical protein ABI224_05210, partial [Acetobacteraceae bacterium]